MNAINERSTKVWLEDGQLHAEWADRALDDEDRYGEDDTFFIRVSVEADEDNRLTRKALMAALYNAFDEWTQATRIS